MEMVGIGLRFYGFFTRTWKQSHVFLEIEGKKVRKLGYLREAKWGNWVDFACFWHFWRFISIIVSESFSF